MQQVVNRIIVKNSAVVGLFGFGTISFSIRTLTQVVGSTKNITLDYAKQNMRVNPVCLDLICTPKIFRFGAGDYTLIKQLIVAKPIGRVTQHNKIHLK